MSSDKPLREGPAQKRIESWIDRAAAQPPQEGVAAATVILLRDAAGGLETLMLRRDSKLDFVGGMWVFPGGRVDAADRAGLAGATSSPLRGAPPCARRSRSRGSP